MDGTIPILLREQNARTGIDSRVILHNDGGTDPSHQVRRNDGVFTQPLQPVIGGPPIASANETTNCIRGGTHSTLLRRLCSSHRPLALLLPQHLAHHVADDGRQVFAQLADFRLQLTQTPVGAVQTSINAA